MEKGILENKKKVRMTLDLNSKVKMTFFSKNKSDISFNSLLENKMESKHELEGVITPDKQTEGNNSLEKQNEGNMVVETPLKPEVSENLQTEVKMDTEQVKEGYTNPIPKTKGKLDFTTPEEAKQVSVAEAQVETPVKKRKKANKNSINNLGMSLASADRMARDMGFTRVSEDVKVFIAYNVPIMWRSILIQAKVFADAKNKQTIGIEELKQGIATSIALKTAQMDLNTLNESAKAFKRH